MLKTEQDRLNRIEQIKQILSKAKESDYRRAVAKISLGLNTSERKVKEIINTLFYAEIIEIKENLIIWKGENIPKTDENLPKTSENGLKTNENGQSVEHF